MTCDCKKDYALSGAFVDRFWPKAAGQLVDVQRPLLVKADTQNRDF